MKPSSSPLPLLLIGALFACKSPVAPKADDTADGTDGADGADGADGSDGGGEEVAWEDVRLETAISLTGAYASGTGFFVTAEQGQTYKRQDGEWAPIPIEVDGEDLNGLWGLGADDTLEMVAVGDGGFLATWTAGAWVVEDIGTANLESVSGPASNDLMAVGWGGVFMNKSGAWTYLPVDGSPRFNKVWYNGNVAFAVGEDGTHAKYADGVWTVTQEDSRLRLYGVSGTKNADMWACGENGLMLHFDGATWTPVDLGTAQSLWAVLALSETDVYVVGGGGFAAHYDGVAWTDLPTGVDNNLYAISASSNGTVWAVGNRGMTLKRNGAAD